MIVNEKTDIEYFKNKIIRHREKGLDTTKLESQLSMLEDAANLSMLDRYVKVIHSEYSVLDIRFCNKLISMLFDIANDSYSRGITDGKNMANADDGDTDYGEYQVIVDGKPVLVSELTLAQSRRELVKTMAALDSLDDYIHEASCVIAKWRTT